VSGTEGRQPPIIQFYRLVTQARVPMRADRSAAGYLPTRATRHCEALTTATSFGWWVFPPLDLLLLWQGEQVWWSHPEAGGSWLPLSASATGAAQYPGFACLFDEVAPPELGGCSPPFLTALPEPGTVQIWTGLLARTAPGWSALVRAPANMPPLAGISVWEGLVETDSWFGPLFTNVRLTRTGSPIRLGAELPLLLVQPVPQFAYADAVLGSMTCVTEPGRLTPEDWAAYRASVLGPEPGDAPRAPPGRYAATVRRRRRRCPYANGAMPAVGPRGSALTGES
jgi:Family of unknown function (DUF6065)